MKNLLVVIDMINGFVNEGALADKRINEIVPAIVAKIEQAKANGDMIVAFRDSHSMDDEEFKSYPPHCLKGSWESELIDALKPYEKDMIVIEKNTTNGFKTPEFRKLIKENRFDNIDVTGCCTDICVSDFTQSLIRYFNENKISTNISISQDSVDTFSLPGHDADKVNEQMLEEFIDMGVEVTLYKDMQVMKVKKMTDERYTNFFSLTYKGGKKDVRWTMVSRRKLPEAIKASLNPDAVHILPYSYVNGEAIVYLTKEFRYPTGREIYGIPAGCVEKGEDGRLSGAREIGEEIGGTVVDIEKSENLFYASAGLTDEKKEIYEAKVKLDKEQALEETEQIKVIPVKLSQVEEMLDDENLPFDGTAKHALRSFVQKQKIKELEAQVETLKRRVAELETDDENEAGE